ncbi:MAG: YdcF family protein [Kiloniellaceae bacterium]
MLYTVVKTLVLPPACFFVLFFIGLLVKRRWPRLGRALLWGLLVVVYLATTPFVAGELMAPLQPFPPVDLQASDQRADAIVVVGAGIYFSAPEYAAPDGGASGAGASNLDVAGALTLQRLQYAAYLARATGKPVLVSGGPADPSSQASLADVMAETMTRDFGVAVRWIEDRSDNTRTNALFSAEKLRAEGIERIYLVTHAWHMPRALFAFQEAGLAVVPAPTRFESRSTIEPQDFVPSAKALLATFYAVHEWLGLVWYRLRG